MKLYVLVPIAVYEHGVIGVYETRELAVAAAEGIWPKTDGHHAFAIYEREVNETHEEIFQYTAWEGGRTVAPDKPVKIVVPYGEEERS